MASGSSSSNLLDDEQALLSLVQDAEGKAWTTSLHGWSANSGIPVCDWDGITCRKSSMDGGADDAAVVTGVNVTQKLSGTIPTELGLLTELEHLTLKNNMLRGSIPQELANLKKLRTLDLTQCFLTGTLPQRFESSQLESIGLAHNAISGKFFSEDDSPHLQSLREIWMENNLLTGTLHGSSIMKIPRLKILSLSDNDLSGLIPGEALGSLPSLHYLYLDSNHFVGPLPSQLAQVGRASILELWVQDNALSGTVPASYARFDQLHDFFIDTNKLTGALPPDICGPQINADFFTNVPPETKRNYCDSIACPAGSVALEGMYPCEKCAGGEAARLTNRYLGQNGRCSDYTQREILELFYRATTKGGRWKGTSDWDDTNKPVCQMTGITCDAQDHVVEISLKNRNLQGHIPDQIGLLSFLETLDVSDNALMGYVPSDLQWTSITQLDISGNKNRGRIPPLLCKMEELNGNGKGNAFHCDRIACPAGTFNAVGFHSGVDGEECQPCYDDSPYIAQKVCVRQQLPKLDWKETVQIVAKQTSEHMGVSATVLGASVIAIVIASVIAILMCWFVRHVRAIPQKKYGRGNSNEHDVLSQSYKKNDESEEHSFNDDRHVHFRYRDNPRKKDDYGYNQEEEDDMDGHSFRHNEHGHSRYRTTAYRDFIDSDDNMHAHNDHLEDTSVDSDEDNTATSWAHRSATDFIKDHQGIALNKREKLKRAVSERMPGDLNRRARETASNINIGARRKLHSHYRKSQSEA
mmetsp:Transcript_13549/g.23795  ORF Transcript_13549/g.23795 Transcript_13549/m.23795 type:complete len:752 (-) Transcript_13549:772-3027(-)